MSVTEGRRGESSAVVTAAQEQVWLAELERPGTADYMISTAHSIPQTVSPEALVQGWNAVVAAAPMLRTRFSLSSAGLRRVVGEAAGQIRVVDVPDGDHENAVQQLAETPLAINEGTLWDVAVLRDQSMTSVQLLRVHHAICDTESLSCLYRELEKVLQGIALKHRPLLEWHPSHLEDEAARAYWEHVVRQPSFAEASRARWSPAVDDAAGVEFSVVLDGQVANSMVTRAADFGVGAHAFITAAIAREVARELGVDAVTLGSPVTVSHGDPLMAGMNVNTLPLHVPKAGTSDKSTLARQVQGDLLDLVEHRDFPLQKVLGLAREVVAQAHLPFDTLVTADEPLPLTLAGQQCPQLPISCCRTRFGLTASVEYVDALPQRLRLVGARAAWSTARLASFAARVLEVPQMRLDQRGKAARRSPAPTEPVRAPAPFGLFQILEAAAVRQPGAIAVEHDGRSVTYRELLDWASALAAELHAAGVKEGDHVGLLADRSVEAIVSTIAVIAVGAFYVPYSADTPHERLLKLVSLAGTHVLLMRQGTPIPSALSQHRFVFSEEPIARTTRPARVSPREGGAYVLFTSGSTGTPKAVKMDPKALSNLIAWQAAKTLPHDGTRTLHFSPLTFDVSFQEIWSTFAVGGTVVVVGDEERRDPALLLRVLDELRVTRLFLPFVALDSLAFAHQSGCAAPAALRRIITAGEQLQVSERLRRFFLSMPSARLENQYGPTETHVVSSYELPASPGLWPLLPPIGEAITGAELWLIDETESDVPVGFEGEIVVAGAPVAHGYIGAPASNGFSVRRGQWSYRTGDLGSRDSDGMLHFRGRRDRQVKIDGHRVELAEVEAALADYPGIGECAVVVEEGDGLRYLRALITASGLVDVAAVRQRLATQLPIHMIPRTVDLVDRLPKTSSGKIDRGLLAKETPTPAQIDDEVLAFVVTQMRGLVGAEVDPDENFFCAGGTSLLAARLALRLREAFGVRFALREILETPSIRQFAQVLSQARQASANRTVRDGTCGRGLAPVSDERAAGESAAASVEAIVVEECSRLLKQELFPHSSFFGSGGSSLQAARLAATLSRRLGMRPTLRQVLDAPSLRSLAASLSPASASPMVEGHLEKGGLSAAQFDAIRARRRSVWRPLMVVNAAYEVSGPWHPHQWEGALREVIKAHEALRNSFTVVETADGRLEVDVDAVADAEPWVTVYDLRDELATLAAPDRQQACAPLLTRCARDPFDHTRPPLVRLSLVRLEDERYVVLVSVDHLVADGASLAVIVEDLVAAYHGSSLTASGSFAEYCQHQAEVVLRELETRADFWRKALPKFENTCVNLLGHEVHSDDVTYQGVRAQVNLDPGVARAFLQAAGAAGVSVFVSGLATLLHEFRREIGAGQLGVITSVANRTDERWDRTVGWFAQQTWLPIDTTCSATHQDFVRAVRESLVAVDHACDMPAWTLRRTVWPEALGGFRRTPGLYFAADDFTPASLTVDDCPLIPLDLDEGAGMPGLEVWLQVSSRGLSVTATADRAFHSEASLGEVLNRYARALREMSGA